MSVAETIRELAIPVVMISANGLICLALYNRLAAITARLRVFYRERFDIDLLLVAENVPGEQQSSHLALLCERRTSLDRQCELVLQRARQVRTALVLLLLSVIGMLLITLLLGLSDTLPLLASVALAIFVVSVCLMIGGVAMAIGELLFYLEPVVAEGHDMQDRLPLTKTRRRRISARRTSDTGSSTSVQ